MNNLTKSIAIGAILLSAVACQKEELKQSPESNADQIEIKEDSRYSGLSIENNTLTFESIEYYESIVDSEDGSSTKADELSAYLKQTTFESFSTLYPDNKEIDDDFVGSILNKDRVVRIGEWFILIDKPNNNVHALNVNAENAYQDLVSMNSRDIKTYSTDEDVLEYLANPEAEFERGCSESSAPTKNVPHAWETYCSNFKIRFKAAYYTLGIYKKLRYEFWHKQKSGNDNNTLFSMAYRYKWKKKCKNEDADVTKSMVLWNFQGDHMELKFYTGSKSLSKYYIGGQWSGGATVAFRSRCNNATIYRTLVNPLRHGY